MITKEQAMNMGAAHYGELHFTGRHECTETVGPRGGITRNVTVARVSGRCQTWAKSPERFRLPVKHGLRDSGEVDNYNAYQWHLAIDCPLLADRHA